MGSGWPTTLDVLFTAHSHILLDLQLPDPLVTSALESYPRLVAHCRSVLSIAFPPSSPFPPTHQQGWLSSLRCLIPWPRAPTSHRSTSAALESSPEAQQIERRYRLWRWGFIGGSVLLSAAYLFFAVSIVLMKNGDVVARIGGGNGPDEEDEEDEGEEDDDEEGGEDAPVPEGEEEEEEE
ncbi:hypothetical protein NUW54_g12953 [Trametes sanguinea]|uniref:Uncharacterized protein n=1 Tax=Trametes sanguinea TaxID=158606 RepID=A0ACC1MSK7_9APHY|nr:hypothetical protein NUW54_g12953 [Trametes sanguinea]